MVDVFLKGIVIEKVRHLEGITIPIATDKKKHLILTGKNGSGKTSLLDALSFHLDNLTTKGDYSGFEIDIIEKNKYIDSLYAQIQNNPEIEKQIEREKDYLLKVKTKLENRKGGVVVDVSVPKVSLKPWFEEGEFILAYYAANRQFNAIIPRHVEKVHLKNSYRINESPRSEFVKYILDLKMSEALSKTSGKNVRADEIHTWFVNFEELLKRIFEDSSVKLEFDDETFAFSIMQDGREPFDFNSLSDGFAAILDIVVDIIVRMQNHLNGGLRFDLPGIVLIDEIETHLHLELQRTVFEFLTSVFPNIQFIISTHSPFVLSSVKDSVVFDLETRTLVSDGLTDLPYEGIVKGYFGVDELSIELRKKYDRYKELIIRKELSDDEVEEIATLELYLDEIPDYLALGISTEYRRLKNDFENRGDL